VAIRVSDTGYGIPPEELPHICDRFYRGKRAITGGGEGRSGLGLAIVKSIVEAHGGRVEFESTPGRGSTFSVYLPPCPGD